MKKFQGGVILENVLCNSYQFEDENLQDIYKNNKIIIRGNGRSYGQCYTKKWNYK